VSRRRIILISAPIIIILVAIAAFMLWPAEISREQAREIALEYVGGGRANRAERDFEDFTRVWSVEVFYAGLVQEVYVSMRTGEVIRLEIDR
jgi:uncharacterized membrane protein YkoI